MVIELADRKFFTRSPTPSALVFVARMLTRDWFAVANHLVLHTNATD